MKKIVIIDYGLGNLLSIRRAVKNVGGIATISENFSDIINADLVILPGVGAFPAGMFELDRRGYSEAIKEFSLKERPLLGICLGMQLLFSSSEENVYTKGLNLISGKVVKLPRKNNDGTKNKIPHIGWEKIYNNNNWDNSILKGIKQKEYFYFVHSYYPSSLKKENIMAYSSFGDIHFGSSVQKGSIMGVQYHPEKSGPEGMKILKNFISS